MAELTNIYEIVAGYLGVSTNMAIAIILIISVWTIIWKGLALWKSARKTQMAWFIILLVVNTIGILEILYIYIFSKIGEKSKPKPAPKIAKKK